MRMVDLEREASAWQLTRTQGFHFLSLISIVVFMLIGFSPLGAVFWATLVAAVTSFFHRDCALIDLRLLRDRPRGWIGELLLRSKLVKALEAGSVGMLNVAATCAAAGLIVGVVTLTGLGLKFSSIVIAYAGGSLILTAIYTALIVWVIGLAVPVTASSIICAVITAPALTTLGVPASPRTCSSSTTRCSRVSPPTALSPFRPRRSPAAIRTRPRCRPGGSTRCQQFIVPFMFVLDPMGTGLSHSEGRDVAERADDHRAAALALVALAEPPKADYQGALVLERIIYRRRAAAARPVPCTTESASLLVLVVVMQLLKSRARVPLTF
jgi:TRAP-type uncharacterized transport system fused permease subunit